MLRKFAPVILFVTITIFVVTLKFNEFEPIERLDWALQDQLHRLRGSNDFEEPITIVAIDELAASRFGAWPWPHERIADLVAAIGGGEPKAILLDCDISAVNKHAAVPGDSVLAEQLSWMQNVTVAFDVIPSPFRLDTLANPKYLFRNALATNTGVGVLAADAALPVERPLLPALNVMEASARLGFRYSRVDRDQTVRWEPLIMSYAGYYYPSSSLAAAAHYLGAPIDQMQILDGVGVSVGERLVPTNAHGEMLVNFSGAGAFRHISAADVLNEQVKKSSFTGQLVIVTVTIDLLNSYFVTPVNVETPEWLKTATVVSNIINDAGLRRIDNNRPAYLSILFALGLLCAFTLPKISALSRLGVVAVALVTLASVNYFMFNSLNIVANPVYIVLQLALFLLACPLLDVQLTIFKRKVAEVESEPAPVCDDPLEARANRRRDRDAEVLYGATQVIDPSLVEAASHASADSLNSTMALGSTPKPQSKSAKIDGVPSDATVALPAKLAGKLSQADPNRTPSKKAQPEIPKDLSHKFEDYSAIKLDGNDTLLGAAASVNETPKAPPAPARETFERISVSAKSTPTPPSKDRFEAADIEREREEKERQRLFAEGPAPAASSLSDTPTREGEIKKLGRYVISGVLGKGAMGTVYEGVDPAINRPVALKTIRLDFVADPDEMRELRERLYFEAQAAGKLSHPHIVGIYDVGSEGSTQYIAMERLQGQTLEGLIKRKANFNYRIMAKMIMQISQALQYAHDQGIVHRDIKPANIMVLPDYSIKVMDFGIARVESSSMTKTGVAMGTPNYISPEQLQGRKIDGRSDIFSLGVVIYEMLVGERPFKGDNITALIYSIMNTEPATPTKINPRVPPLLEHITMRALKKDPNLRYQRASEIAQAVSGYVESFAGR